ncbi:MULTISPECIES: haloacid dehalogenase-like hydrolase [Streptosporangium]|uniref:Phosphoglycolate phosphatase-like HAD superfamily hydrolase n=1 Tax=Streptosporangium brasiliense TaxID=47480 RepID=A0ABT9R7E3_9ACTN|nr:haloacid dehalogenase-like hydrolase [Streptosporangium brasiliense]MDP9864801.1 phosphoglycolate phosphatase-like HAD superfamily hydrolase [Streptosporangium brasiliense]
MGSLRTLVLWDIDHTLINADGIGRDIYAHAFRAVTGQSMERVAAMAGRTDWAITVETLRMHGVEVSDRLLESFGTALAEAFVVHEAAVSERGRVLTGVREVLDVLAGRGDVVQSVLTGNMEPLAIGKLRAFGLEHFVDFEVGAYGMDHEDRAVLVGLAQERAARKYGEPFTMRNTVLVGDTPNDVLAGHLGGARVVAVATGSSDVQALKEAGAELVLEDLTDTDAVVRAVLVVADR